MRRCVVILLLLVAAGAWAQSVTISQSKLDELTGILQDYVRITQQLQTSLDNSQKRIDALQVGLTQYENTVNQELLPKAKALEGEMFWLKVGTIALGALVAGESAYIGGHALRWW